MKSALLIIDMQEALCTGPWAAHDIGQVVARVNGLSQAARAAGMPVVFIQHEEAEGPLVADSPGWQVHAGLLMQPPDIRVRKAACDSFHKTPLHATLQALRVDRLVVCGLQTEFCVDSTVRGALAHGYPVTLVADGHSTLDNGVLTAPQVIAHHNATLAHVGSFGPRVSVVAAQQVRWAP